MNHRHACIVAILTACLLGATASARAADDEALQITVDGEVVATSVPPAVKGRNVLLPGDLVTKLGVSIQWSKKKMTLAHGDAVITIPIDGGKKGGDLAELDRKTEVPRVPVRILRDVFNINIAEWKRGQESIVVDTKEKYNPFKVEEEPPKIATPGALIPDFTFTSLDGKKVAISSFAGKRLAILVFASWDISRDTLGAWQEYVDELAEQGDESLQVVGVAVESIGDKWVSKYVKRARATFPVLIDGSNHLSRVYGFQNVPVVILADELQVYVRLMDAQHPKQASKAIEKMLKEEYRPAYLASRASKEGMTMRQVIEQVSEDPANVGLRMLLAEMYRDKGELEKAARQMESAIQASPKDPEVLFRWGLYLWLQEKKNEGISKWREAAVMGPKEMVVRKQIWALEHPERFYKGKIDLAWQQIQIQKNQ